MLNLIRNGKGLVVVILFELLVISMLLFSGCSCTGREWDLFRVYSRNGDLLYEFKDAKIIDWNETITEVRSNGVLYRFKNLPMEAINYEND